MLTNAFMRAEIWTSLKTTFCPNLSYIFPPLMEMGFFLQENDRGTTSIEKWGTAVSVTTNCHKMCLGGGQIAGLAWKVHSIGVMFLHLMSR